MQIALDLMQLNRAVVIAHEAVDGGADWVEVGTPLIKSEGAEAVVNRTTSGTTDLGLYSGRISYKYDGTSEMFGTFQNGHPTVIMTQDPNGDHAFVIAISEDQRFWVTNHEGANGIHGIMGFK